MRRLRGKAGRGCEALGIAILLVVAVLLPAGPAHAVASAGASQKCDAYGHCVTGTAFSSNGGVNLGTTESSVGTALAVCKGGANGSVLIEVTCSIGSVAQTTSIPGTAGAAPVVAETNGADRVQVCWRVVGYFPNLSGEPYAVSTAGCALFVL